MAKSSSRQEGQDALSERIRRFANDYMTLLCSGPVLQLQQMADDVAQLETDVERGKRMSFFLAKWVEKATRHDMKTIMEEAHKYVSDALKEGTDAE